MFKSSIIEIWVKRKLIKLKKKNSKYIDRRGAGNMKKCLLTVDWDYFIATKLTHITSYAENRQNIMQTWYKLYFEYKNKHIDIKKLFRLGEEVNTFWEDIKTNLKIKKDIPLIITESHIDAYEAAQRFECDSVYLVDAHSDLGYGGIQALNFEVNCANWLGMLLKDEVIDEAKILYSPYTHEEVADFKEITNLYGACFVKQEEFLHPEEALEIEAVHICRSGPWTPPWYDYQFDYFCNEAGGRLINEPPAIREWDTEHINLANQIEFMLGIV